MRAFFVIPAVVLALAPAPAGAQERRAADPGAGPAWSARVSESEGGRTCASVLQGTAPRGRYCDRLGRGTPFAYNVGYETPPERENWRTVLVITFSPAVVSATLTTPDGVVRYRRGVGPRVLLAVVAGRLEDPPPLEARVRAGDGSELVARGGADPAAEVADPFGGPAWRTVLSTRARRRACVSWKRVAPRYGEPPALPARGRTRCGNPAQSIVALAAERAGGRLVVTALLGRQVRSVALRGPGSPRLTFDRASRSALAVLPETVDPATLTLVARLRDGRTVRRPLA